MIGLAKISLLLGWSKGGHPPRKHPSWCRVYLCGNDVCSGFHMMIWWRIPSYSTKCWVECVTVSTINETIESTWQLGLSFWPIHSKVAIGGIPCRWGKLTKLPSTKLAPALLQGQGPQGPRAQHVDGAFPHPGRSRLCRQGMTSEDWDQDFTQGTKVFAANLQPSICTRCTSFICTRWQILSLCTLLLRLFSACLIACADLTIMRWKDFYRWRREQVNKQKVEWDKAGAEPAEQNDIIRLNWIRLD